MSRLLAARDLLSASFDQWRADDAPRMAAALAYYALVSFAPLLVIGLGLLSFFFDDAIARDQLLALLDPWRGSSAADVIAMVVSGTRDASRGALATVIGTAVLAYGATGLAYQLKAALNHSWRAASRGRGFRRVVHSRAVAFVFVIASGLLLVASLLATAAMGILVHRMEGFLPANFDALRTSQLGASLALVAAIVIASFKVLPDVSPPWRETVVGGVFTALLFMAGTFVLGEYLARTGLGSAFGAAGSVVALLVWVNYSAQIYLYGAAVTRQLTIRRSNQAPGPVVT